MDKNRIYQAVLSSSGVAEHRLRSYQRWVDRFVHFVSGVPLEARGPEELAAFLDELDTEPGIRRWQVLQAADALKIYCRDVLKADWAASWAWRAKTVPAADAGAALVDAFPAVPRRDRVTADASFRDRIRDANLREEFTALIDRLRTEVRCRGYSHRTEKTYEHWALRCPVAGTYPSPSPGASPKYSAAIRAAASGTARATGSDRPGRTSSGSGPVWQASTRTSIPR